MDDEISELDSLYAEHFGRTPCTTPVASQELSPDDTEEEDERPANINDRAREYLDCLNSEEEGSTYTGDEAGCSVLTDDEDICRIRDLQRKTCGCKHNCINKFQESQILSHVFDVREMQKDEKELYIIGSLVDCDNDKTKRGRKRERSRPEFIFAGKKVCRKTFMIAFDIGKQALQNIRDHMKKHGPTPRKHGNIGSKPAHALKFEDVKSALQFIQSLADEIGLPQPAAPRGRDTIPPIYIPSDVTTKYVHSKYVSSCDEGEHLIRCVKYSTFCGIWNHCLPHIKIAKPRDDVCATCEKFRKLIIDSVSEEEKIDSTTKMQKHITHAQEERALYNNCIKEALENGSRHFTFDFSQNVNIPHHARQMGPLFFLSLRKIQIFGFRIDDIPKQLNFLIDENETIGCDGSNTHGPDSVISMIDWSFSQYGTDDRKITIHADNCSGQNKNQFVIGYLMWRIMTGQQDEITYMMQVPGHARCIIDGGFALIKKLYRRSDCDSIDQLERIVEQSSVANSAVRYPTWQWREWKAFLSEFFKPLKGIRKYHHFCFKSTEPGTVTVKESVSSEEIKVNILKDRNCVFNQDRPAILQPTGLSDARKQYLFTKVRPFVRPAQQDMTCPPLE